MKTPMSVANSKPSDTATAEHPRKSGVFVMASNRPPLKAPKNPTTNPTTPAVPRVAAPRSTSTSLHPNISSRSPRSSVGRDQGNSLLSGDASSPSPAGRPLAAPPNRPPSTTGHRVVAKAQHPPNYSNSTSPRFFHASDINQNSNSNARHAPQAQAPSGPPSQTPKFFTADSLKPGGRTSPGPGSVPHVPRSARSSLGATSVVSPPTSRPVSMVEGSSSRRSCVSSAEPPRRPVSLTPTTAPDSKCHVKFVYANGMEEILAPRNNGSSEVGSSTSSPPLPTSPKLYSLPMASPALNSMPQSPLTSPNPLASPPQLFTAPHCHSRRSSIDSVVRHGRTSSSGSVLDSTNMSEDTERESIISSEPASHETDEASSEGAPRSPRSPRSPPMQTAASRIKAMEEAAAAARRERKVMDLEISNASLMAINKTLEREMRKQTAELRRYRRLSRSGRLSLVPSTDKPSQRSATPNSITSEGYESSLAGVSEFSESENESEDTEVEGLDEEDSVSEEEDTEGVNDEKHRAADEKRLAVDMSKHQALLDNSAKMNRSLKRCSYMTDQLINEARKALEYKVRPSDVQLGGHILTQDDDEDYAETMSIATSAAPSEDFATPRVEVTHTDDEPED